jgi:5-methylthioribose kinase
MLLCDITQNLGFADDQFVAKLLKAILNSVNNTNLTLLRHDNDVEADRKTRYKVLRAVKIQGNNFDSKKSLLISDCVPRLE